MIYSSVLDILLSFHSVVAKNSLDSDQKVFIQLFLDGFSIYLILKSSIYKILIIS